MSTYLKVAVNKSLLPKHKIKLAKAKELLNEMQRASIGIDEDLSKQLF